MACFPLAMKRGCVKMASSAKYLSTVSSTFYRRRRRREEEEEEEGEGGYDEDVGRAGYEVVVMGVKVDVVVVVVVVVGGE